MTSITKTSDRPALASCLSGFSAGPGLALSSASLNLGSLRGSRAFGSGLRRLSSERPTQAPVAAAAAAYACVPAAAHGAGTGAEWLAGFTAQQTAVVTKQRHAMRAFRGLEPWRDPS